MARKAASLRASVIARLSITEALRDCDPWWCAWGCCRACKDEGNVAGKVVVDPPGGTSKLPQKITKNTIVSGATDGGAHMRCGAPADAVEPPGAAAAAGTEQAGRGGVAAGLLELGQLQGFPALVFLEGRPHRALVRSGATN